MNSVRGPIAAIASLFTFVAACIGPTDGAGGATPQGDEGSAGAPVAPPGEEETSLGTTTGFAGPVTGHPRLWITPADLPRLRSWANSSNPIYQEALLPVLALAEDLYSSKGKYDSNNKLIESFFPPDLGGAPNPKWPDNGTTGVGYPYAETVAQLFAFFSLLQTDPAKAAAYAQKARKLLMYVMNAADTCVDQNQPYCGKIFAYFNRANYVGEAFGLTVDWIYPYFSAADKAVIRRVFLKWAGQMTKAGFMPDLANVKPAVDLTKQQNPQLLSPKYYNNRLQYRWSANNYYSGTTRDLLLMTLSLDAGDDPAVDAAVPKTTLGNSLGSYLPFVFNVAMYQQYAIYSDPQTVIQDYGLASMLGSVDMPGGAGGGLPVEGMMYGHSLGYILEGLLALHTAGYDDVATRGPQAGLYASPYWDKVRDGFLASLTRDPVPTAASVPYGQIYQTASFGDVLSYAITYYDHGPLLSALAVRDRQRGNQQGLSRDLWAFVNTMQGGAAYLTKNYRSTFQNAGASAPILAFMALDPTVPWSSYTDPRPGMPLTFVQKPIARVLARTDWSSNATWFTHICGWKTINHQVGDCGQFEIQRKGEWLTTERHGYDNTVYANGQVVRLPYGYAPDYHNTLGLQNDLAHVDTTKLSDFEKATAERGGQWINSTNAGDPTSLVSAGDALPYAYAQDDMTNLYNRVLYKNSTTTLSRATAIKHASRGVLWVKPDHVVVYDRATSGPQEPGAQDLPLFKRFNLVLVTAKGATPVVTHNAAGYATRAVTPKGQSLFIQTVLPSSATPQLLDLEPLSPPTNFDPTTTSTAQGFRFRVELPATSDARFLHVLQGADAGHAQDPVSRIAATGGTAFEGVRIAKGGRTVVALFPVSLAMGASFASMTYTAPAGASDDYILDLRPSTTYYVTGAAGGVVTIATTATTGSTARKTDEAGVLRFTL